LPHADSVQVNEFNLTLDGQIDYWGKIGKIAEENPDLSFAFIKEVLFAREEALAGDTDLYLFD
jgi:hypothetical protein